MTDEKCGHPTANDTPCQHPTTDDGDPDRCWIDAHNDAPTESDDPGRHSSLSPDDHDAILEAARDGLSKSGCARAAGVTHTTLNRYLEANPEFRSSFAQARARGEQTLVAEGLRDPETDSSMAKFLLSTSFDYVKTEKKELEHSGDGGGALEVVVSDTVVDDDE